MPIVESVRAGTRRARTPALAAATVVPIGVGSTQRAASTASFPETAWNVRDARSTSA